ncbi:hypothetical protein WA026_002852 [Henosepilachna vigintioctopunctata]|uniref:Uncharacterized protein n=1 Tax=Henosepilachna vigintioctopunctata TaxID=420089 RepID=A0AAW1U3I0_9CUCU
MLSKGADTNIQDKNGNTDLHLIANRNSTEKMKEYAGLLNKYDADFNAINDEGETPVHTAVNANCGLPVDVLFKEGPDVNMRDNMDYTPVTKAFSAPLRSADILRNLGHQLIMQHECKFLVYLDVFCYIIGYEGFMNFKIKFADELLKLKQKMIHKSIIGYYDLLIASPRKVKKCLGSDDILQALIIFDENKYIFGNRIIRNFKKVDVIRLLRNRQKFSVLLNILNCKDNQMHDYWRIDHSFFNPHSKQMSVMKILRNSTHCINLGDKNSRTVLHCVANVGIMSCTQKPLKMGADVNAIRSNGFTPLHLACMSKHEDCMGIILNYGPSLNVQHSKYCTPLHLHFLSGMENERLLKKMLSKGADPIIQDKNGNTTLQRKG